MSLKRVPILSPNFSSRSGNGVRLIVLHTAEGARTYQDLGHFFQGNVQASSHVGTDDTAGVIGEYVRRDNKAWAVSAFNPISVSIEQCAFAAWSRDEWMKHPNLLANTAAWIAEEAAHYGIPIVKLDASQAQGSGRGICQHRDLGSAGGGHDDCGDGYPIDHVLDLARGGSAPTPTPAQEETNLVASAASDGGTLHVFFVDSDHNTVHYDYQKKGENAWNKGGVFAVSDKEIAGISASLSATGTLEVFVVHKDGSAAHAWQNPNSTSWSGGQPGKTVAGFSALPS